jgi:hypothetical protein
MEVEDEDAILQRLYLKKFGCVLPEIRVRNSDVDNLDLNMIDLTGKDDEETEASVAATVVVPLPIIIKTEPKNDAPKDI